MLVPVQSPIPFWEAMDDWDFIDMDQPRAHKRRSGLLGGMMASDPLFSLLDDEDFFGSPFPAVNGDFMSDDGNVKSSSFSKNSFSSSSFESSNGNPGHGTSFSKTTTNNNGNEKTVTKKSEFAGGKKSTEVVESKTDPLTGEVHKSRFYYPEEVIELMMLDEISDHDVLTPDTEDLQQVDKNNNGWTDDEILVLNKLSAQHKKAVYDALALSE